MRYLLCVFIIGLWTGASFAERRVALVFGADRYETLRPLANAVNDARAVEASLEQLGFEVFSEKNRDLKRMRRALEDFEEDAAGADVAFVFFAGHGVEIAGDNRLLPTDADASTLESLTASSLALNEVQTVMARVAKTALIVLDACRDDPFAKTSDPTGRGLFSLDLPDIVRPGLGRMGAAENTLFAFSAAPGETASDGQDGNSPFTKALTKYLDTEGLEIRSILTLVQQEVYDRTRGRQLPYVESGLPSLFFANQTARELPERERLLLAMADIDDAMRQDVERVAAQTDVPLAPLYGALIGSELANLDRQQRSNSLKEAAAAFTKVRDELRSLRSGDESVTLLRQQAEAHLSLGAFNAARTTLTKAAEIDASSRDRLKANLTERTLSEAATHYLNGGAALAELQYPLALADYRKAVTLFSEVDSVSFPRDAREQQLNALAALGRINVTLGSLPNAAAAYDTQLTVSQVAKAQYPGDIDLQLTSALAHDNLGDVLFEQGRIADALTQYRAGHGVRRALTEHAPDNEALQFALSNSHERLGRIFFRQGDLAAAQLHYLDKHRLAAAMVAARPNGYRWHRDLSVSDEKLGDVLRERGDLEGALARYQASLDRMIPIRDANPLDLELNRFTSITLDRLGEIYAARAELALAKTMFEQSRALRSALVAADPAHADWQYVLGISHERIGDVLIRMGDIDAATIAYEDKYKIVSRLSLADPTNVRWARDLSVADERLGKIAHQSGDLSKARMHYQRSLDRMRPIRNASPTDMELNRFLSFTQDHLAGVLLDDGQSDAALALYESSLALREALVAHDPQNADWRFVLGVSHERIGRAYLRLGRPEDAIGSFEDEVATMSVLLKNDPDNLRWHRAVSISNEWLGDAHLAAGAISAALAQYKISLARMSAARDANPETPALQRFTAVTWRKIGNAYLKQQDTESALQAFASSLNLAQALVEIDQENARWQRDLLLARAGMIDAGHVSKETIELALNSADKLRELGEFSASDQALLDRLTRKLDSVSP